VATDAELVGRAVGGDPAPFVELVRRHEAAVHRYLSRRVGADVADDLLSEVWMAAFTSLGRFDGAWSSARPWLFGIARNRVRSFRRLRQPSGGGPDAALNPWPDVDTRLATQARGEEIRAALRALPAEEREVLLLVAWEELTPSEAAIVLEIPAGTARSRLHRARMALRRDLAALSDDVSSVHLEGGDLDA
jgi:RNA polymerase sigma factor (sigma-70 family)